MPEPTQPPDGDSAGWYDYARYVMIAAANEDWQSAHSAMVLMQDQCGPNSIVRAMALWVDTALMPYKHAHRCNVELAFKCSKHGRACPCPPNPASTWAGQFIAARLAGDAATQFALLAAIPDEDVDANATSDYVMALLYMCHGVYLDEAAGVRAVTYVDTLQ